MPVISVGYQSQQNFNLAIHTFFLETDIPLDYLSYIRLRISLVIQLSFIPQDDSIAAFSYTFLSIIHFESWICPKTSYFLRLHIIACKWNHWVFFLKSKRDDILVSLEFLTIFVPTIRWIVKWIVFPLIPLLF